MIDVDTKIDERERASARWQKVGHKHILAARDVTQMASRQKCCRRFASVFPVVRWPALEAGADGAAYGKRALQGRAL